MMAANLTVTLGATFAATLRATVRRTAAAATVALALAGIGGCRAQLEEPIYVEEIVRELLSKSSELTQEEYADMIGQLGAATDLIDMGGASGRAGRYLHEGAALMDSCLSSAASSGRLSPSNLRAYRRWQSTRPY